MSSEINLLPQILQEEQKTARIRLLANTVSVIVLILFSTFLAVCFSYRLRLTKNLTSLNQEIGSLEQDIAKFREEEGLYRFLTLKIDAFAENLKERQIYGSNVKKIREIFTNTANIEKMTIEKDMITIFGEAVSFPEVAVKFAVLQNNKLFENVEITSIGVNQEKGVIEFGIQGKLK